MKIYELVEIHKGEEETTSTIGFYTDENLAKDWLTYMQVARMLDFDSGGFCQKINFGTIIVVDHLGELLNCNEVTCPFVDKETPDPSAVIDGNDLYLRRLKQ